MANRQHAFAVAGILASAVLLQACSSAGNAPSVASVAPDITQQPVAPLPTGPMKAADITRALSERKFSFASAGRKGTVTYFRDGTFEYDEAGKGLGTGIWQASDGKLCEARNPTSFLPKGTPSSCSNITSDGTRFTVGAMQLIPI